MFLKVIISIALVGSARASERPPKGQQVPDVYNKKNGGKGNIEGDDSKHLTVKAEIGQYPGNSGAPCVTGYVSAEDLFEGQGLGGVSFTGKLVFDKKCGYKKGYQGGVHIHAGTTCSNGDYVFGHFCPWVGKDEDYSCLNDFGDPWFTTYVIQEEKYWSDGNSQGKRSNRLVAYFDASVYGQLWMGPEDAKQMDTTVTTGFTPRAPPYDKYFSVDGPSSETRPSQWNVKDHAVVVHEPTELGLEGGVAPGRIGCGVLGEVV